MSDLTDHAAAEAPRERANWVAVLLPVVLDVAVPTALFYILRGQGFGVITSGLLSGILPAVRTLYSMVTRRRVDGLALFMLSALIVGGAASLLMHSARLLLAKDGAITALCGLWMLGTLARPHPFFLHAGEAIAIAKRGPAKGAAWARRWVDEPAFRRGLRLMTALWGTALVLDAVVRIVLAYSLPVDEVPLVTFIQWYVLGGLLYAFTFIYAARRKLLA
ncbi:VC0807 family protein [Streptomyces sp. TP-A0356]|uniref:VC0807 family protein n=1 Tax=Streptomyces sp. TP-A0356 TaxID=1359208 RepID=UPI0006E40D18|nr:VC0807 family protein [Streptomyces sp. TP-A0356]